MGTAFGLDKVVVGYKFKSFLNQMTREDIHNVILDSIDLIDKGEGHPKKDLSALELPLDKLARARKF